MTLFSRASIASSRIFSSSKPPFLRSKWTNPSTNPQSIKTLSTQTPSSMKTSRLLASAGNVILGTMVIGAGAGTILFTYLRLKDSGFQFGVQANTIMEEGLHPAEHPWPNNHPFATFDHARYAPLPPR
jgi:hypothetical protein